MQKSAYLGCEAQSPCHPGLVADKIPEAVATMDVLLKMTSQELEAIGGLLERLEKQLNPILAEVDPRIKGNEAAPTPPCNTPRQHAIFTLYDRSNTLRLRLQYILERAQP